MTMNLSIPAMTELKPRITVVGVGGAGGNAVNNMISAQLEGVEFVVANTDAQALSQSLTDHRIQIGTNVTQGLGAGSNPEVGAQAADESMTEIMDALAGSHMIFIAAGMGGGTGTGAAPVIAQAAREAGMLTVGVTTKPFQFEGAHRMAVAEAGIEALEAHVDTLIIIPNQNLFRVANEKTTFAEAFTMADNVLYSGVRGVTDLMVMPGLVNLDFADVRAVMMEMGKAMMGTGEAEGDDRALGAAEAAISNPLLDEVSMNGARAVLINITGGPDLTLHEVDLAANRIGKEVDPNANIIVGSILDETLTGRIRVSVVATGIDADQATIHPHVHRLYPAIEARGEVAGTDAPAAQPGFSFAHDGGASVAALDDPPAAVLAVGAPALATGPVAVHRMEPMVSAPQSVAVAVAAPAPRVEEAFIAPPPLRPEPRRAPLRAPDPFAEAALENAPVEAPKKRTRATLLERMASVGLRRGTSKVPQGPLAADEDAGKPAFSQVQPAQAAAPEPAPEPGVADRAEPAPAPVKPAPVVAEPGPEPRALAPEPDEDLLEIPAFLRRQAN